MTIPVNGGVDRMLGIAEDQAKATGQLVEINSEVRNELRQIRENAVQQMAVLGGFLKQLTDMEIAREKSVNDVKAHVTLATKDKTLKVILVVLTGVLTGLATVLAARP